MIPDAFQNARDLCNTVPFKRRVKPGIEQVYQAFGNFRIAGQCVHHIGLAESDARLTQILRIGPQHHDIRPFQPSTEHKTVEPVIFHIAGPDTPECLLELCLQIMQVERMTAGFYQFEIMDPHFPRKVVGGNQIGVLRQDLQAHVLQHWQTIRECKRCFPAINLEPHNILRILYPAVEVEAKLLRLEDRLDFIDIVKRQFGIEALLISRRKGIAVPGAKSQSFFLAPFFKQGIVQIVRPTAGGINQPSLQLCFVDFRLMLAFERNDIVNSRKNIIANKGIMGRQ